MPIQQQPQEPELDYSKQVQIEDLLAKAPTGTDPVKLIRTAHGMGFTNVYWQGKRIPRVIEQAARAEGPIETTPLTTFEFRELSLTGLEGVGKRLADELYKKTLGGFLLEGGFDGMEEPARIALQRHLIHQSDEDSMPLEMVRQSFAILTPEQRASVQTKNEEFLKFYNKRLYRDFYNDEEAGEEEPGAGFAAAGRFAHYSQKEISAMILDAISRPEDEIIHRVWDNYTIPMKWPGLTDKEHEEIVKSWVKMRQLIRAQMAMSQVGQIPISGKEMPTFSGVLRSDLERMAKDRATKQSAFSAMTSEGYMPGGLAQAVAPEDLQHDARGVFNALILYRFAVEEAARKRKVSFEQMEKMPLTSLQARDLLKSTDELLFRVQYGEAADKANVLIHAERYMTRENVRAMIQFLDTVDLSQLEGGLKSEARIDDIKKILEGIAARQIVGSEDAQGRVDVVGVVLRELGRPLSAVGAMAEAMSKKYETAFFVDPDGNVWQNPIVMAHNREHRLRNDPLTKWEESPYIKKAVRLAQENLVAERAEEGGFMNRVVAGVGGASLMIQKGIDEWEQARLELGTDNPLLYSAMRPVKPTMITMDVKDPGTLAEGLVAASRVLTYQSDGVFLGSVVTDAMRAGMAPDNFIGQLMTGLGGLTLNFVGDPLLFGTGGYMSTRSVVQGIKSLTKKLRLQGVEIPMEASPVGPSFLRPFRGFRSLGEIEQIQKQAVRTPKGTISRIPLEDPLTGQEVFLARHSVPNFRVLQNVLNGDEKLARSIASLVYFQPGVPENLLRAAFRTPEWQNMLFRRLKINGIRVVNEIDAGLAMESMIGPITKILEPHSSLGYMVSRIRGLVTGRNAIDRHAKAYQHARGLYLGRIPLTPIASFVKDAQVAGIMKAGEKIIKALEERGAGSFAKVLRYGLNAPWNIGRTLRFANWNVAVIRSGPHGRSQRVDIPFRLSEQMRLGRNMKSARTAQVESMNMYWMLTEKGKLLPTQSYMDLNYMLDLAKGATADQRWESALHALAFSRKARAEMPHLTKLGERSVGQLRHRLDEIAASITPEEVERLAEEVSGLRFNFNRTQEIVGDTTGFMPRISRDLGLFDPRDAYAPHFYKNINSAKHAKMYDLWQSKGYQRAITELHGATPAKTSSRFTWRRDGPPTLIEAEALGYEPILDLRVSMYQRLWAFYQDADNAEMLLNIGDDIGAIGVRGKVALRRLLTDDPADQLAFMRREKSLTEKAAEFEKERQALVEQYVKAKEQAKKIGKSGLDLDDFKAFGLDSTGWKVAEGATDAQRELLDDLARLNALRREGLRNFAAKYDLEMERVLELAETSVIGEYVTASGAPRNYPARVAFDIRNIKNKIKKATGEEKALLEDKLARLKQDRDFYLDAKHQLEALGIDSGDTAALFMELYGVPSLYDLSKSQVRAFVQRGEASLGDYLTNPIAGRGIGHENIAAATAAMMKDPVFQTHYAPAIATSQIRTELERVLSNTYLPVETWMMMHARGFAKDAFSHLVDTAAQARVLQDINTTGSALVDTLDSVTRFYKSAVTTYMPSTGFTRRNQGDAILKMLQHSGLDALNPNYHLDYMKIIGGSDDPIIQGTGGIVSAKAFRDTLSKYVWQTYEMPLDVQRRLAVSRAHSEELLGAQIGKRARKTYRTQHSVIPVLRPSATHGKLPGILESAAGWGPVVNETWDNYQRGFIAYMEVLGGSSPTQAAIRALDLARDWSNMHGVWRSVVARLPVMFVNFYKQNTKSIFLFAESQPSRLMIWPKIKQAIEGDLIPEDMRPAWSNALDTIMGPNGVALLAFDLGALQLFDGLATILGVLPKAWQRGDLRMMAPALRFAGEEAAELTPPWMSAFAGIDARRMGRLNLPLSLRRKIYDKWGPHTFKYKEIPIMRIVSEAGEPQVQGNKIGRALLMGSGAGQGANALMRGWRRAELGHVTQSIMDYVMGLKFYDYDVGQNVRSGAIPEAATQIGEAMEALSTNSYGMLEINRDLPMDTWALMEYLLEVNSWVAETKKELKDVFELVRPQGPVPLPTQQR